MGAKTKIAWADATWNPVTGCTPISAGCENCYAKRFAERWRGVKGHFFEQGFDVAWHEKHLLRPIRWTRPKRIFVCSMGDLFHANVPLSWQDQIYSVMALSNWHQFYILTKRADNMRTFSRGAEPLPHVMHGVTVEHGKQLGRMGTLSHVDGPKFISCEPLLDDLGTLDLGGIDWVIVGGESGPNARPMNPNWARNIRDQCIATSTPFFFKQWGGRYPKANGRILDGKEWKQLPK